MPARYRTTLRYMAKHGLSTGTLGLFGSEHTYRLNSLFDPDFTSTGHQPFGFDQLSVWYDKYLVTRARIELTVTDPTGDGLALGVAVRPTSAASSLTGQTIDVVGERQGVMIKCINDSGEQVKTLLFDLPIHEVLGITQQEYHGALDSYGASVSANPLLVPYMSLAVINLSNATNYSAQVLVRMSFDCIFYERKVPGQS